MHRRVSVPGAIATGSRGDAESRVDPVATARGTDTVGLIPSLPLRVSTLPNSQSPPPDRSPLIPFPAFAQAPSLSANDFEMQRGQRKQTMDEERGVWI